VRALTNEGEPVHDEAARDIVLELEQRQYLIPYDRNSFPYFQHRSYIVYLPSISVETNSGGTNLPCVEGVSTANKSCRRSPVLRMCERANYNLQRNSRMRTTIYLATACGLAVIRGRDESWVGEVCLKDKQIQCVAADRTRKGIVYCGTLGNGMFRSCDRGANGTERDVSIRRWWRILV
jgi:hypothetical protein